MGVLPKSMSPDPLRKDYPFGQGSSEKPERFRRRPVSAEGLVSKVDDNKAQGKDLYLVITIKDEHSRRS